jgi:metal-responsive CopG/Arc/MetJ family transcriptional regulator
MSTKIFNLSLPSDLVALIDTQAKREYATRSEYIKRAIMAQLKTDNAFEGLESNKSPEEAKRAQLKEFLKNYSETEYIDDID